MFKFIKYNRKQIIISFVAGLILLIIKPLLSWIGGLLINTMLNVSNSFSDYFYVSISKQNPNLIDTQILILLVYGIGVFLLYLNFVARDKKNNLKVQSEEQIDSLEQLKKKIEGNDSQVKKSKDEILADITDSINSINEYKSKVKIGKTLWALHFTSILLFLILFLSHLFYTQVNEENTSFQRDLKIVRYNSKSDSLIYKFEAKWVQMKNKEDYDRISNSIQEILKNKETE